MEIKTLEEAMAAAFRGSYRGLRHQAWKRATVGEHACALQSRPGCHCAIGWITRLPLITLKSDESLDGFIGAGIDQVTDDRALALPLQRWWNTSNDADNGAFYLFLLQIQHAHDKAKTPRGVKSNFERMRVKYGWPIPS